MFLSSVNLLIIFSIKTPKNIRKLKNITFPTDQTDVITAKNIHFNIIKDKKKPSDVGALCFWMSWNTLILIIIDQTTCWILSAEFAAAVFNFVRQLELGMFHYWLLWILFVYVVGLLRGSLKCPTKKMKSRKSLFLLENYLNDYWNSCWLIVISADQ